MDLVEWAFVRDLPTAEKLVLVYLAHNANSVGLGLMDRGALERATGYKKRSIQRLLKSLRDDAHLEDIGPWFRIGPSAFFDTDPVLAQLAALPDDMRPVAPRPFGRDDPIPDGATVSVVGHQPNP